MGLFDNTDRHGNERDPAGRAVGYIASVARDERGEPGANNGELQKLEKTLTDLKTQNPQAYMALDKALKQNGNDGRLAELIVSEGAANPGRPDVVNRHIQQMIQNPGNASAIIGNMEREAATSKPSASLNRAPVADVVEPREIQSHNRSDIDTSKNPNVEKIPVDEKGDPLYGRHYDSPEETVNGPSQQSFVAAGTRAKPGLSPEVVSGAPGAATTVGAMTGDPNAVFNSAGMETPQAGQPSAGGMKDLMSSLGNIMPQLGQMLQELLGKLMGAFKNSGSLMEQGNNNVLTQRVMDMTGSRAELWGVDPQSGRVLDPAAPKPDFSPDERPAVKGPQGMSMG